MIETEIEMARPVVGWLQDMGWDVYQEVEVFERGRRADIVAVLKPKIWVIEVKRSHGLELFEQALAWRPLTHYVSIAVPCGQGRQRQEFRNWCHESLGIGLLVIGREGTVEERVGPQMNRRADTRYVREALCDEQKTWCDAGSQHGYYTSFGATRDKVFRLLKERPGLTMKEIFEDLGRCHYCSTRTAATALANWVRRGVVNEIKGQREGRYVRYYPAEKDAFMATGSAGSSGLPRARAAGPGDNSPSAPCGPGKNCRASEGDSRVFGP